MRAIAVVIFAYAAVTMAYEGCPTEECVPWVRSVGSVTNVPAASEWLPPEASGWFDSACDRAAVRSVANAAYAARGEKCGKYPLPPL